MAQSDTICITDKEYNNLLIKGQCKDIIKADSALLWDKDDRINDLYNKIQEQKELVIIGGVNVKIAKAETKVQKVAKIKAQFIAFGIGVLAVLKEGYDIFINHKL